MRPFGLRSNHVMCLYHLGKNPGGITLTRLAESCREDKGAVSRCVAQLIQQGYVCGDFPENKRSYRTKLYLTEEGRSVAEQINSRIYDIMVNGGDGLTDEQRTNLYAALEIIVNNLTRYIEDREE